MKQKPEKTRLYKFESQYARLEIRFIGCFDLELLDLEVIYQSIYCQRISRAVLEWEKLLQFGHACTALFDCMHAEQGVGITPKLNSPGLRIEVTPSTLRQVKWQFICSSLCGNEILDSHIRTEYQLLNSISTHARRMWKYLPGAPSLGKIYKIPMRSKYIPYKPRSNHSLRPNLEKSI